MKVVLSAETGPAGDAAREWCTTHLGPADEVIAVVGLSNVNELVLGIPPFDGMVTEGELLAVVEHDFCRRLRKEGIPCVARFRRETQARVVADAVLGPVAVHVVHHPPCPVVVVPAAA